MARKEHRKISISRCGGRQLLGSASLACVSAQTWSIWSCWPRYTVSGSEGGRNRNSESQKLPSPSTLCRLSQTTFSSVRKPWSVTRRYSWPWETHHTHTSYQCNATHWPLVRTHTTHIGLFIMCGYMCSCTCLQMSDHKRTEAEAEVIGNTHSFAWIGKDGVRLKGGSVQTSLPLLWSTGKACSSCNDMVSQLWAVTDGTHWKGMRMVDIVYQLRKST